jgi:hypothetical protein
VLPHEGPEAHHHLLHPYGKPSHLGKLENHLSHQLGGGDGDVKKKVSSRKRRNLRKRVGGKGV